MIVSGLQGLRFITVAAGRHSAGLTEDNRLFVWGHAFICEKPLLLPQELRSNKQIRHIAIGEKSSAIIDEDQRLYTWGTDNTRGQLGIPSTQGPIQNQDINMPQLVESLGFKSVTQVAVGLDFMLALGLDYDQFGHTMAKPQEKNHVQETYEERYPSRPDILSRDASPYSRPDYSEYTPQQPQKNEKTGRPPIIQNEKTPTNVAKQSSYQNLNLNGGSQV